ncbi:extracellular solute-binding protein [Ruegeria sp. EL01]|uniref:extracellular solute-binding protein n=1 Tax=Ruegeria sp. EL01 TaxID=2107578 RepID=UPI000EA819C4|nr:extracellular solute-binding protein [Ruegeria sp. EL01]
MSYNLKSALSVTAAFLMSTTALYAADDLNALVWCDHTDPALLQPFEEQHGVRVNVKEYEGTAAGFAILDQSRTGDWDIMVIDTVDVARGAEEGRFASLPADAVDTSSFFPEVVMADNNTHDGQIYGVTEKFGYNTIAFNSSKVDAGDMEDMSNLWSGKYDGRIAVYDYYLPVLGLIGLEQGIATSDLDAAAVERLRDRTYGLKSAALQVSDVVASQTALATGEVDILIGGGEWVTAVLSAENPELDWSVPAEGALRWSQSVTMLESSENQELALEFIKYITGPEGQARLATSSCYWGMPANSAAGRELTDAEKAALRWDQQADYLIRTQLYPTPDADLDLAMQDLWTDMLQQ